MSSHEASFQERSQYVTPIQDLGLTIAGTRLEPIIAEFKTELERAGIRRVQPRFYLSTEWGVGTGTVAIGIPFYLARPDLTTLHAERMGHVEGFNRANILRYLRHEMGHVVNYAYHLYEQEDWVKHFGSITQPYLEAYRPEPFSRRFVRHLPGWYAQKHPDEDWSETFAVWMTPNIDWRHEYGAWPEALAKLEYCHHTMLTLANREPLVTADDLDQDVSALSYSIEEYYRQSATAEHSSPLGLMGPCAPSSKTSMRLRMLPVSCPASQQPCSSAGLSGSSRRTYTAGPGISRRTPAPCCATWQRVPNTSSRSTPRTSKRLLSSP